MNDESLSSHVSKGRLGRSEESDEGSPQLCSEKDRHNGHTKSFACATET